MELLTAINRIMPILGERPVTSLDSKHPTLALLLPKVDTKIEDLTATGWWFNAFNTTLYTETDGRVPVPADTLSFVPDSVQAAVRGPYLFNPDTMTYVFTGPVTGKLVQRLPFNLLPETAAQYVWYSLLVDAYITDIGLEQNVQAWMQQAADARTRMEAEHLRQRKYSTIKSTRFGRIANALRA